MRVIHFTLPEPTPLLNTQLRKHFRQRSKAKIALARQIIAILGPDRPAEPMQKARVTVTRFSCGLPDYDNLYGGVKDALDVLTTPAAQANGKVRNKYGIGLIVDDSPKHINLIVEPVKCRRSEQRTEFLIEEIEA
ncbi:hypothetical protein GOB93_14200 [Acetobacter musti]|uniref:Uncharacterized protein n=1 Tax=Acetobacter musti TaxID=864732 RepID=A0ABX0JRG8_9PROT|nr:hypothetical protein [Acetobacter musti]NHN85784.1 hypothetical protein [Acetobacter musti]